MQTQEKQQKKPSLFPIPEKYLLVWESVALDEEGVPEDVKEIILYRKPNQAEVEYMKKLAFARGYKLVSFDKCTVYPEGEPDEF